MHCANIKQQLEWLEPNKATVGMTGTNSKNPIVTCPTFYRNEPRPGSRHRLFEKATRYEVRFPAFAFALKPAAHVYDQTHHHRNHRWPARLWLHIGIELPAVWPVGDGWFRRNERGWQRPAVLRWNEVQMFKMWGDCVEAAAVATCVERRAKPIHSKSILKK